MEIVWTFIGNRMDFGYPYNSCIFPYYGFSGYRLQKDPYTGYKKIHIQVTKRSIYRLQKDPYTGYKKIHIQVTKRSIYRLQKDPYTGYKKEHI